VPRKNGHLPLALIVRAFSAFLERRNQRSLFAKKRMIQREPFLQQIVLARNRYTEVKTAITIINGMNLANH
jgi:hypothetical protein